MVIKLYPVMMYMVELIDYLGKYFVICNSGRMLRFICDFHERVLKPQPVVFPVTLGAPAPQLASKCV